MNDGDRCKPRVGLTIAGWGVFVGTAVLAAFVLADIARAFRR